MSVHVARLESRGAFDVGSIREQETARGISVVIGRRHGSKTEEGVEYQFASDEFTAEQARAWCASHGVVVREFASDSDALVLEADGTYTMRGIECAEEGTWYAAKGGKVDLTADLLESATNETNAAIDLLRPALTLGHGEQGIELAPNDGQPRLGFASKFYRSGKKVLCDLRKVPAVVVKALRSGLWGRISPTLMMGWPDPQTNERRPIVFSALALLGATPPAISTLQDLSDWIDGQTESRAPATAEMALCLAMSDVVNVVECGAPVTAAAAIGTDEGNSETQDSEQENEGMTKEEIIALVEELIAKALSAGGGESEEMKAQKAEMAGLRAEMYTERLARAAQDGKLPAGEIKTTATALMEMSHGSASALLTSIESRESRKQPTTPVANANAPADPLAALAGQAKVLAFAADFSASGKGSYADGVITACRLYPADAKQMRAEQGLTVPAGGN